MSIVQCIWIMCVTCTYWPTDISESTVLVTMDQGSGSNLAAMTVSCNGN